MKYDIPILAATREIFRQCDARLREQIRVAPLSKWLQAWPDARPADVGQTLSSFMESLSAAEVGPWVLCLPPARSATQTTAISTQLLAASRVGAWGKRPDLANAVRSWLVRESGESFDLVTGVGLTCRDLSLHAAYWFGRNCWEWIPPSTSCFLQWSEWACECLLAPVASHHGQLWVSPAVDATALANSALPLADQLAFASATRVRVLSVRENSTTWQLTRATLETNQRQVKPNRSIHVYVPTVSRLATESEPLTVPSLLASDKVAEGLEQRKQRKAAHALMDSGAVGWYLTGRTDLSDRPIFAAKDVETETLAPSVSEFHVDDSRGYLSHHTRQHDEAWPEEDQATYWFRWLIESQQHVPSAFESLLRILCQQRIRAGRLLIPQRSPVVCFSARCPLESVRQRTFRPHLRRWDYEPYGIAIQRQWLIEHGAKQVTYLESGKAREWWEQPRYSRPQSPTPIDWSLEQEYRIIDDVSLNQIPRDKLFAFVPTLAEAQTVSKFVNFPVKYFRSPSSQEATVHKR